MNSISRSNSKSPNHIKLVTIPSQVATLPSTSRVAEVLDALGVALLAQGRPREAEEAFRGALQTAPLDEEDAEWAANNLAVALKAQGSERYGALGQGCSCVHCMVHCCDVIIWT